MQNRMFETKNNLDELPAACENFRELIKSDASLCNVKPFQRTFIDIYPYPTKYKNTTLMKAI